MNNLLRFIFYQLIVRPVIYILLGLNIKSRYHLPQHGPAILVANHNSHLDTMVLMSLFPWKLQKKIFPVAAADYFLKNKVLAWFSQKIVGIIPITRNQKKISRKPFANIQSALDSNNIVIFYPEGSRGEPEQISEIRKGIGHLAKANPEVPVYPVYIYGLGKSLPKNEALLVPFVIDVVIGQPFFGNEDISSTVNNITESFLLLKSEVPDRDWS